MKKNYQDSFVMTSGTALNALLGLGFYVLLARALNPSTLGEFSFFLVLGVLGAELSDWGSSNALVKFGQHPKFGQFLFIVLIYRALIGLLLIGLGIIGAILWNLGLMVSSGIAISLLMVSFTHYLFLGQRKIWAATAVNLGGNGARFLGAFLFLTADPIFNHWLLLFIAANIFSLLLGIALVPFVIPKIKLNQALEKGVFKEMFNFSFWLGSSFSLASLAAKLDIPLLYTLGGSVMTGIYSLAQKFTSFLPQLVSALEGVFAPKLLGTENKKEHFRDYIVISLIFSSLLILLIPVYPLISTMLFGHKYDSMVPVLSVLVVGLALFSLSGPFATRVVYEFGKSKYHLLGSAICFVVGLLMYLILIPKFGAVGAAIAFVIVQAVNLGFYVYQSKTYE